MTPEGQAWTHLGLSEVQGGVYAQPQDHLLQEASPSMTEIQFLPPCQVVASFCAFLVTIQSTLNGCFTQVGPVQAPPVPSLISH